MFWISIGFLSLVVVATVLYPFLRGGARAVSQVPHGIRVYRDQLAELDRDVASGLLTEEQAGAARIEVERRILAATATAEAAPAGVGIAGRRLTMAVIAVVVPAGAVFTYLTLGNPALEDLPLAMRTQELKVAEQLKQVDKVVSFLEERVEKVPDDADAWGKLGRLYSLRGRPTESAKAYGRVHALKPQEPDAAADHGEAMVYLSEGKISTSARKLFEEAIAADPKHIKARFYLGSAMAQAPAGLSKAIEIWSSLESDAPPDAPWLDVLRRNLRMAEIELASLEETGRKAAPDSGPADVGTGADTGADASSGSGETAGGETGAGPDAGKQE